MRSFGKALEHLAESLDISPTKYDEAVQHYRAVGEWLNGEGSPMKAYRPRVFPQGSFRLGTVVRPVRGGRESDYDIDLVCCLDTPLARITPRRLKHLVGDRIKEHGRYAKMLDDEGRRCWTLNYAESDGIGFHLDVLPSVLESESFIKEIVAAGVRPEYARHAIGITERSSHSTYSWVPGGSNPEGYAAWFDDLNAASTFAVAGFQKRSLFESNRDLYASVEEVPDALVRSPLQRVIQLLKRHRDVRFFGHEWESEKPISMILTTIAARAYQGEMDINTALFSILDRIDDFTTSGVMEQRGEKWWVPNPVNPDENFADRWNDAGSHRAEAFFEWVQWLRQDLALAEEATSTDNAGLAKSFGVSNGPFKTKPISGAPIVLPPESVPQLAATSHCQAPQWPMLLERKVNVEAFVHRSKSAKSLWKLSTRSLPKDFWIRFSATSNARPPYKVVWQVVNTGEEAAQSRQLRGGFDDGEGSSGQLRWESTCYRGTHWVEAFVIKDGKCVARSGKISVRIR